MLCLYECKFVWNKITVIISSFCWQMFPFLTLHMAELNIFFVFQQYKMYSAQLFAERKASPASQERKVTYLMDQCLLDLLPLLWIRHIHHIIHFVTINSPQWSSIASLARFTPFSLNTWCRWMHDIFKMADNGGGGWTVGWKSNFATQSPETSLNSANINSVWCGHTAQVIKCQEGIATQMLCGGIEAQNPKCWGSLNLKLQTTRYRKK